MFLQYTYNYNYIYNEQDNVSWLHIELLNNALLFLKNYAIFLKDTYRNSIQLCRFLFCIEIWKQTERV